MVVVLLMVMVLLGSCLDGATSRVMIRREGGGWLLGTAVDRCGRTVRVCLYKV